MARSQRRQQAALCVALAICVWCLVLGVAQGTDVEGELFLKDNAEKKGVVVLPSGLQYKVRHSAAGEPPARKARAARVRTAPASCLLVVAEIAGPETLSCFACSVQAAC